MDIPSVGAMHAKYLPKIFSSCIVGGVIEKGMSVEAGGAKYSSSGGFLVALANAADSLAAIEKVVFQEQMLTLPELVDILHKNFEGNERVRQILIKVQG
ncbi:MAG: pyruvate formate lyase family protein [Clostridiales bacterium]|nr:pyruvate formate lyase family protein [Clostridiales bacterium]